MLPNIQEPTGKTKFLLFAVVPSRGSFIVPDEQLLLPIVAGLVTQSGGTGLAWKKTEKNRMVNSFQVLGN